MILVMPSAEYRVLRRFRELVKATSRGPACPFRQQQAHWLSTLVLSKLTYRVQENLWWTLLWRVYRCVSAVLSGFHRRTGHFVASPAEPAFDAAPQGAQGRGRPAIKVSKVSCSVGASTHLTVTCASACPREVLRRTGKLIRCRAPVQVLSLFSPFAYMGVCLL